MYFDEYLQNYQVRVSKQVKRLARKYRFLPRKLVAAIYFAGLQDGVTETNNIYAKMAELVANGANEDDLLVELQFNVITKQL